VNADRRPIPEEILRAVAEGAMPLAVFADWLEEVCGYPAETADNFRRAAKLYPTWPVFCDLYRNSAQVIARSIGEVLGALKLPSIRQRRALARQLSSVATRLREPPTPV
jgi:hypothetical protein